MLDQKVLTQMVEQEISKSVNSQISEIFATNEWFEPVEQKIVKYTQDRILGKFASGSALPEIVDAVKSSIQELFNNGLVPGIDQYIDSVVIKQSIDQAVEQNILNATLDLGKDPIWVEKIERMVNQSVVHRITGKISSIDITTIINQRVDENMVRFQEQLLKNFSSTGIDDKATSCQLTVFDETTVFENKITARNAEVVDNLTVKNLIVKGGINTDNRSWNELSNKISKHALEQLTDEWKTQLIDQVKDSISQDGIEIDHVKIGDTYLLQNGELSRKITQSNLQKIGTLTELKVRGETQLNDTLSVVKGRVGVNTELPESALSIWDEEVSIGIGKHKHQEAYIGTNRTQSLNIVVNKESQIQLGVDGVTAIKKLQIGHHRIGHCTDLPGWSGTRGDVMFNANPTPDNAFAWVCLGGHKWKVIKNPQ